MKVIQINCVCKSGSTGAITAALHQALLEQNEGSLVFYGRGKSASDQGMERTGSELYGKLNGLRSRISGLPYGGCETATARLLRRLREEKPDVVHLHCTNGTFINNYSLIAFLNKNRIPTVVTLHAEFFYTANCSHAFDCDKWKSGCGSCTDYHRQNHAWFFDRTGESWRRMHSAFLGFERLAIVSVSPWQMRRAEQSPFFCGASHQLILNGVDTGVFHPYERALRSQRRQVVYVTPCFDPTPGHIKGGAFVLTLAGILGDQAEIQIIGPSKTERVPENVRLLGPIRDRESLAKRYSDADVTLLTSRRETFSMVCAESLCCGTPVAGFLAGGPESISLAEYSRFYEQGDVESLARAILSAEPTDRKAIGNAAASTYGNERMIKEYLDLYRKVRR